MCSTWLTTGLPAGGIGPVRNLKFTKYFRDFGWEPVVYAPLDAHYPSYDESTFRDMPAGVEILRRPIREPYGLFNLAKGKKKDAKVKDVFLVNEEGKSPGHKLGIWMRANFFVPDARAWWIRPSIKFLREYLKQHPVDAMISYGPPHSMHLIALQLHREFGIPWISDWQDPWTQIDYYEKFPMLASVRKKHEALEQQVLKEAGEVVMVSRSWCADLERLSGRDVQYIPFGYDEQDMSGLNYDRQQKFIISHYGTFGSDRNPLALWRALQELLAEIPELGSQLQVQLAGQLDASVVRSMQDHGLKAFLHYEEQIPRSELFQRMAASAVQLVLINKPEAGLKYNNRGRIAAKVFECLGVHKPILVIGPHDGDVAQIIRETFAGTNCSYEEQEQMKEALRNYYSQWKEGLLKQPSQGIEQYSFRNLCGQMSELLDRVVE